MAAERPVLARMVLWVGLPGVAACLLFLFFLMLISLGAFGFVPRQQDLRNLNQNVASEIYTVDSVLLGKFFIENRLLTELDSVSSFLTDALVSTEDARFFEHGGIDFKAALRVLFRSILAGDESGGGGSTISQQLAKNLYPRKSLGILTMPVAKFKEMIIARRLERVYNKEEILGLYLNTVPFGENVFGIRMAALRYFSTTPYAIRAEEAAVLIGMLKANTAYNPVRNPDRARERRNVVLQQMVKYGHLSASVADSLSRLPVSVRYATESHNEGLATYFRESLRLELEQELREYRHPDGRPYNIYTDGLKIYTTLHSRMQAYAEESVRDHMRGLQASFDRHFADYPQAVPWGSDALLAVQKAASPRYQQLLSAGIPAAEIDSLFRRPVRMTIFRWDAEGQAVDTLLSPLDSIRYYLTLLSTGLLAADPHTGAVRAWVGGIDFRHFKFDHIKAVRQVGSTFKPVVYALALENGVDPCERFPNEYRIFEAFDNWAPRNVDGRYGGYYSMRGALRMSVNTVAVHLILRMGIDNVRDLARRMGITSDIPLEPGIALGAVDATLYEMVRLFAVFANRGVLPVLHTLDRIETADGLLVADFSAGAAEAGRPVMSPETADKVRYLLQSVVDGGTGGRLRYQCGFYYPAAGKTGTTDNNSDGWFIGFTPDLIAGAWVGAEQPLVRWQSTRLGQGGASALPLAGNFLAAVYADSLFQGWRKHAFPPLPGDVSTFDCYDYIPSEESLLDSIAFYENLSPDSIGMDVRDSVIQYYRESILRFGYGVDSLATDSLILEEEDFGFSKPSFGQDPTDEGF
jgi:penicillin-binding protein 1A